MCPLVMLVVLHARAAIFRMSRHESFSRVVPPSSPLFAASPFPVLSLHARPTCLNSRQVLAVLVAEDVLVSACSGRTPSAPGVHVLHDSPGRQILFRHLRRRENVGGGRNTRLPLLLQAVLLIVSTLEYFAVKP